MSLRGFQFEDFRVWRLPEIELSMPLQELLPRAHLAMIDADSAWLLPSHIDPESSMLHYSVHSWVLRTPTLTVLIDSCCGNHKNRTRPETAAFSNLNTPYLERLAALRLRPEDIDIVLCTHLHVDHVGWNTRLSNGHWIPTFPNAHYLFSRADRMFWDPLSRVGADPHPNDGVFEDSIAPVIAAGQAVLVEDGHTIEPGLTIVGRPGHTPGHINLIAGARIPLAIFSGDTLHHPLQAYKPNLNSAFCEYPELARQSRHRLLESVADANSLLLPAHFCAPNAGRVQRRGSGYAFTFEEPTSIPLP